jgi:predicted GNAT superfamily acetyltransferase
MSHFEIRALHSLADMEAVEALQRLVWDAPSTVVYAHMLISFARNGGSVIGAFDNNNLIGFVLSYLGIEAPEADRPAMANLKLVSQRMAVLPDYRNSGVGYDLKLAQRKFAIDKGIRLVTWTFDPLQSRNAYFNMHKLGGIAREYHRDYYGNAPGPLVSMQTSDRLLVEWWVTSNRVEQRVRGTRPKLTISQYLEGNAAILNPTAPDPQGFAQPVGEVLAPESRIVLVEIPDNYGALQEARPELALIWRGQMRDVLERTLNAGYAVTDVLHGEHEGRARSFYALSYADYGPDIPLARYSSSRLN